MLKEDLKALDAISEQSKFLVHYKVDTAEQVTELKATLMQKRIDLLTERTALRNERRRVGTTEERKNEIEDRLKFLTSEGNRLNKDIHLCDAVLERSTVLSEKTRILQEQAKSQKPAEKKKDRGRHYGR